MVHKGWLEHADFVVQSDRLPSLALLWTEVRNRNESTMVCAATERTRKLSVRPDSPVLALQVFCFKVAGRSCPTWK